MNNRRVRRFLLMTIRYPDPLEFKADRPTFHQRYRLVLHSSSDEDARERVKRLADIGLPCDLEIFLAVTDGEQNENRGEVVLQREFCGVAFAPAAPDPTREPQTPRKGDKRSPAVAASPQSIEDSK